MLLDRVTDNDSVIGQVERGSAFRLRANFRVVHVLVLNPANEMLVQRIAEGHPRHPGFWGSSVAGYVAAGETYEEAARRKLEQELGIRAAPHFLGKTCMNDEGSKKFIGVYALEWEAHVTPNTEDIQDLRFIPYESLRGKDAETFAKHKFTPTFRHVLNFLAERKLPAPPGSIA